MTFPAFLSLHATMATFQDIQLTLNGETGVALVRLDRPAKRNAFSQFMIDDLVAIFSQLDNDDSIRAVVLTGGADGPFCGGFLPDDLLSCHFSPPITPRLKPSTL
jgi:enoyl-CoA hydratase